VGPFEESAQVYLRTFASVGGGRDAVDSFETVPVQ